MLQIHADTRSSFVAARIRPTLGARLLGLCAVEWV